MSPIIRIANLFQTLCITTIIGYNIYCENHIQKHKCSRVFIFTIWSRLLHFDKYFIYRYCVFLQNSSSDKCPLLTFRLPLSSSSYVICISIIIYVFSPPLLFLRITSPHHSTWILREISLLLLDANMLYRLSCRNSKPLQMFLCL